MSTPLPDWTTRDSFRRDPHQRHIARTNELSNLTAPAGGQVLRTPFGTGIVQPPAIRPMVAARAKFTTFPNQANDPGILLCKLLAADGTTEASAEFPVIGMEPHVLNDTLIVWQPPGGALGQAYNARRGGGTATGASQDYIYSVDSTKVVWQEFTTRVAVKVLCAQYPNYSNTYPYTCKWWHVRDSDFWQSGSQRSGVCAKAEEFQYQKYGVTPSSGNWKEFGQNESPALPAIWTGDYDESNTSTPTPVFLTGFTPPTDHDDGFPDSPGFADQAWARGGTTLDPGTSGSHPATTNGAVQMQISVPGGTRTIYADFQGRLTKISTRS